MRLEKLPTDFLVALPVLKKIHQAGFDAYFVGGSVRDALLNKPIHDIDIATSAYPQEIKAVFPRTIDIGIEHGTVLVLTEKNEYEITTFRTESTYQDFRRPDKVEFVRSLEEDLKRRDFTINAFAINTLGDVIDLFDGLKDLKEKKIRAVGSAKERFHEDALRMMRAARFASQLDFKIEQDTLSAMKEHAHLLNKISVERVRVEFVKLMQGINRQKGLRAMIETESFLYLPGLLETDRFALERLASLPLNVLEDEGQIWALTAYCLGLQVSQVEDFLRKWKESNAVIKKAKNILSGFLHRLEKQWEPLNLYRFSEEEVVLAEEMRGFFGLDYSIEETQALHQNLPIYSKHDLLISGKDLLRAFNRKQGKWLGEVLNELEIQVVRGEVRNDFSVLLDTAKEILGEE